MSLIKLPLDILSHIFYCQHDQTCSFLVRTCKTMYKYGKKTGYIKNISMGPNDDGIEFLKRFCEHSHTISYIKIESQDNPQVWIPKFTKKMVFIHCEPPSKSIKCVTGINTKHFVFHDYNRKLGKTLIIDWMCFKNIEILDLYVFNVDLTGIEILLKLKNVNINVCVSYNKIKGVDNMKCDHFLIKHTPF